MPASLDELLSQMNESTAETKPATSNPVSPLKLNQYGKKSLMISSRQMTWTGIVVEQYQISLTPSETEVAETSDIDLNRIEFDNCFSKQDWQLQHIAMLLLAELESGGMIGQLYVESLTQVLVIHLLRNYSNSRQIITAENRSLTHSQLQQAIEYIHTHLNHDLSLIEIARVINISPTYFASLFKRATGTSPHQYVIQQRVERAKMLLKTTNLKIADIALQVGFSSQSHLTQQFKRLTRMTPKQAR